MRSMSTLNPVLVQRRETAELVRTRMSHLFAEADADADERGSSGSAESSPPVESSPPAEEPAELPGDWPRGYGPRRGPSASLPKDAAGTPSVDLPSVTDPPSPSSGPGPGPGPGAGSGPSPWRRLRLPAALHSALLLDRRAVLGLSVLLLLAVAYAVQHFWLGRPQTVAVPAASAIPVASTAALASTLPAAAPRSPGSGDSPAPSLAAVVVDVAGKVAIPGIRSLPGGSRVADAVRAAGGVLPGVDTDGLNLARVLVDGEQILVGSPSPPPADAAGPRPPVSLNHATLDQLDALPGVGPVLARHIIDFRTSHAGFHSLDQLRQISGIGDRKLAELRHLVTL